MMARALGPHPDGVSFEALAVLRHTAFRRLWLAQSVSLVGDWFTLIALAVAVSRASSGSGLAVGGLLLTQLLPTALVGPLSGVLADRFDRRRLLVVSDLTRAAIVLMLIPAVRAGALWPVFALALLHFSVATVFEPARSALVPRLVGASQLVAATTLTSVTWSVMTALGGMLGGSILAAVGTAAAFVADALTFAVSAALIVSMGPVPAAEGVAGGESAGPGLRDGLRYVRSHPVTGAVLGVKAIAGIGLVDTFLVLYATHVFPRGEGGAISLGLLWACFGVGAMLGPALLNLANDGSVRRMRRLIVVGSALIATGLGALALAPTLTATGLAIVLRGMGGSTNWTYSTVILQKVVPDGLRGRVLALDLACLTLTATFGTLAWGWAIDRVGVRPVLLVVAAVCGVAGLIWAALLPWMERDEVGAEGLDSEAVIR
jgi:MFS family permease